MEKVCTAPLNSAVSIIWRPFPDLGIKHVGNLDPYHSGNDNAGIDLTLSVARDTCNRMKAQISRRIVAGFVLAVAISGGAGVLLYRAAMQFRENRLRVQHGDEVLSALQTLSAELDGAEGGARLYVLTGDSRNLSTFNQAVASYPATLQKLQELTQGSSSQRARLADLHRHVDIGIRILQGLVETRRDQGMEAVLMQITPDLNRREQEAVNQGIAGMRDEETSLLQQRRHEYESSVQQTSELFTGGIVTQCLLLLLIFVIFLRDYSYRIKSTREIQEANVRLAAILGTMADGLYQLDFEGRLLYLNPAGERLLGYQLHEIRGMLMHDLIHSHSPQGKLQPADQCPVLVAMRKGESYSSLEGWYQRKDGAFITVECTSTPLRAEGVVTGAVVSFRDITERQRRDEQLRSTTALQRAIFQSANVSIVSTDAQGIITSFNPAAERMVQFRAEEMIGKTTPAILHDQDEVTQRAIELTQELGLTVMPGFDAFVAKAVQTGVPDEREWTYVRKDGSRFPVYLSLTVLRDSDGHINGFLGIAEEITERKKAELALRESETRLKEALMREQSAARVDFLTGVFNRRGFYEIAESESQRSRRYKRPLSLVYVDIDNFKTVNDSMGHEAGDELLIEVAAIVHSEVRGTDTVGRLGGDEFAVLLPETDQENSRVVVEKLQKQLMHTMRQKSWPVTFSIGLISFQTPPNSIEAMVREADRVMYSVKLRGKNSMAMQDAGAGS